MDFLDPTSRRNHLIRLFTGYILVAIAILLAAFILLMVAYGFGIGKNGQVIQSGLLFVSSQPSGASVYIDGISNKKTNVRYNLPEGAYMVQLKRAGYRTWQRQVAIPGGKVVRYDYPFLFPQSLTTSTVATYNKMAGGNTLATVTPDNRWLLIQPSALVPSFDIYDLKVQTAAPQVVNTLTIPASVYTAGGHQSWKVVDWADDSKHLLLQHGYGTQGSYEFILVDRTDATKALNLNTTFGLAPTKLTFINDKYDQYYLYRSSTHSIDQVSLGKPTPVAIISDVLTYDGSQPDTVAYTSPSPTNQQMVDLRLWSKGKTYTVRELPAGSSYLVAAASYKGDSYVTAASSAGEDVYVYKNPLPQLQDEDVGAAVPTTVLKIDRPTFVSFSAGGRLLTAERGTRFVTYDNQYRHTFTFTMPQPIDAGQSHATWMDGARLQYVSNHQLYVFDFDGKNQQLLMPALNNHLVFYDPGFRRVYTLMPPKHATAGQLALQSTWLLTKADR